MYYERLQRFSGLLKEAALSQAAQDIIRKYSIKRIMRALRAENTSLLLDKAQKAKKVVADNAMAHAGFLPEQIKGLRNAEGGMLMAYEPTEGVLAFTGHRSNPEYSRLVQELFGKTYVNDAAKAIETIKSYGQKPPSLLVDYRNPAGGAKSIRRIDGGDRDIHEGMVLAGGDQVGRNLIPRFAVTKAGGNIPGSSPLGTGGVYGSNAGKQIIYDSSKDMNVPVVSANDRFLVYKAGNGLDSMFRHASVAPIPYSGKQFTNMNVASDIAGAGLYMRGAGSDDLVKVSPLGSPKQGPYHLFGDDFTMTTSRRGRPKLIGNPSQPEREYAYVNSNFNNNRSLYDKIKSSFDNNNADDRAFIERLRSVYRG